jgi:hypothetical protein
MLKSDDEAFRLWSGALSSGVPFVAAFCEDPKLVLARVRSVLQPVFEVGRSDWPSLEKWEMLLPEFFVAACANPESEADSEAWLSWWRNLDPTQQADALDRKPWTLAGWLYWFEPHNRTWRWLGAGLNDNTLFVELASDQWPTASGALVWLLRACGATNIMIPD